MAPILLEMPSLLKFLRSLQSVANGIRQTGSLHYCSNETRIYSLWSSSCVSPLPNLKCIFFYKRISQSILLEHWPIHMTVAGRTASTGYLLSSVHSHQNSNQRIRRLPRNSEECIVWGVCIMTYWPNQPLRFQECVYHECERGKKALPNSNTLLLQA